MEGMLFMLGTVVIEGGLVLLIMSLFTASEREQRREDDSRRRVPALEPEKKHLSKAA